MAINYLSVLRMKLRALGRTNAEVFDDVYRNHRWGSNSEVEDGVSSGRGSFAQNTSSYEELVRAYIADHGIKTVADVGCGDFQVSKRILDSLPAPVDYTGLDVSAIVIDRNTARFGGRWTNFVQHDATLEKVPAADLVLIREVMQHLPNDDIRKMLANLDPVSHVLATNTVAIRSPKLNIDLPPGSASRAGLGSGLALDEPPFSCTVEELLRVRHADRPTEIVTVRILASHSEPST